MGLGEGLGLGRPRRWSRQRDGCECRCGGRTVMGTHKVRESPALWGTEREAGLHTGTRQPSAASPFSPCISPPSAPSPKWAVAIFMRSLRGSHDLGLQGCHQDKRPIAGHHGGWRTLHSVGDFFLLHFLVLWQESSSPPRKACETELATGSRKPKARWPWETCLLCGLLYRDHPIPYNSA